jgi:3-phosphoglycerate kinase
MSYFWIVLAILGAAALGASMTVIKGYLTSMLVIVVGGVLLQASIAAVAMHFGREKRESRRRRYAG